METANERPDYGFAKALVVDDMPSNLVMAAGMLKKYNIRADAISNGQEALERIKSGEPKYAVVFMDVVMPDMDGMATVRLIRGLDSDYAKNIPVIAVTGDEFINNETMFLESGFQGYIEKPLTVSKLDPVLRKWLRKA